MQDDGDKGRCSIPSQGDTQPGCGTGVIAAVRYAPFWFVGPGSNFATVLDLCDRNDRQVVAGGEDVMEAARLGLLDCAPKEGGPILEPHGYEGMPDIEITHRYWRTAAGDWALAPPKPEQPL